MANVLAPRGFKPIRRMDGAMWTGQTTPYRIASGEATAIYTYDLVKVTTNGVIQRAAAGDQVRGIFMGVQFLDANGKVNKLPYWPAGQTLFAGLPANVVEAYVVDDPNIVVEAQFNGAAVPAQADVGATFNIAVGAGVAGDGLSRSTVDYSTLAATAQTFRLLKFLDRPDNDPLSANPRGEFTFAVHDYRVNTGI